MPPYQKAGTTTAGRPKGFIRAAGETPPPHREHGTHVKYVIDKCRCFPCRVANSNYETARNKAQREALEPYYMRGVGGGRVWQIRQRSDHSVVASFTDRFEAYDMLAEYLLTARKLHPIWCSEAEIRELLAHMRSLIAAGVGRKQMAIAAGVSTSRINEIFKPRLRARKGRPARRRIRRTTADKILAVGPADAAGGARVPAERTWMFIDCLCTLGISKRGIAAALLGREVFALQMDRDRVMAATARRMQEVHDALWFAWADHRTACACDHRPQTPSDSDVEMVRRVLLSRVICTECDERIGARAMGRHLQRHGVTGRFNNGGRPLKGVCAHEGCSNVFDQPPRGRLRMYCRESTCAANLGGGRAA